MTFWGEIERDEEGWVSQACCMRTVEEEYLVSCGGESCSDEEYAEREEYITGRIRRR